MTALILLIDCLFLTVTELLKITAHVTKPAEFKSAVKHEFYERVDEDGKATTLSLGWV